MFWAAFAGSGIHTWLIIAAIVALILLTVRAYRMSPLVPESHPDGLGSLDLRERGLDPVDGLLEWEAHEAAMNARAERLGYRRG